MTTVTSAGELAPDPALIDEIGAELDLREPNVRALRTIAQDVYTHSAAGDDDFFEGVIDSATGMGKSFIIAAGIDYFAQLGIRNFAIITPGSAIQKKTIQQFSAGTPKSLLPGMQTEPLLVHADNFDSASMAAEFADDETVKLYVFTVQSLLKPTTKAGRRAHEFQEGLGEAFYKHLDGLDDLIVFADEHHIYGGPKFSEALRGLTPLALIGLTATPDEKKLQKAGIPIIYRYPLAAAIKDRYVKTPVIVGRRDDASDERTQLLDGGTLLRAKEQMLANYSAETGEPLIHPIMLVSAQDIAHAKETVAFLRSDQFFGGEYAGDKVVLEIHSDESEEALAALDQVEDPGSPTRIIVQVGMLKEGWDVKNVYVLVSLRALVSEVLTEQTLGRGLRLPFGQYVADDDYQLLNELDVVSHERYRELLAKTGTLTQAFIDYETRAEDAARIAADEAAAAAVAAATEEVSVPVVTPDENGAAPTGTETGGEGVTAPDGGATIVLTNAADRTKEAGEKAKPKEPLPPRTDLPKLQVPFTRPVPTPPALDLSHVTEPAPFREIGRRIAVDPEKYLARAKLVGSLTADGRSARVETTDATTKVAAADVLTTPAQGREQVVKTVTQSASVGSRPGAAAHVDRLVGYALEGAGDKADLILTRYPDRLAGGMIRAVGDQMRELVKVKTVVNEVISAKDFEPRERFKKPLTSQDRYGKFLKSIGYEGWNKGLYDQAWFDSSPERDLANVLDQADEIELWVRLHLNDLPILWAGAERTYNPDFLARSTDGDYWIVEIKDDRHMDDDEVREKRHAALAWANTVNAEKKYGKWHYLLISETELANAKGSWPALVKATEA